MPPQGARRHLILCECHQTCCKHADRFLRLSPPCRIPLVARIRDFPRLAALVHATPQYGLVVIADLVFACFDAMYQLQVSTIAEVIFLLNMLIFGGLGVYYVNTSRAIMRMLKRASSMGGSNARVVQFSKNIQRVGVMLLLEVCALLAVNVLVFLSGESSGANDYVGSTVIFAFGLLFRTTESLFLVLSYRPNPVLEAQRKSRLTLLKTKHSVANQYKYGSSADLGSLGSMANLQVHVDGSRFSDEARASPSPGKGVAFDSTRASHDDTDGLELTRSPSRAKPSPLARSASKLSAKSFKSLASIGGSNFNLFDEPAAVAAPASRPSQVRFACDAPPTVSAASAPEGSAASQAPVVADKV